MDTGPTVAHALYSPSGVLHLTRYHALPSGGAESVHPVAVAAGVAASAHAVPFALRSTSKPAA